MSNVNPLTDQFGREHNYLRIAITDSCNLRCTYCMPEDRASFLPQDHLMSSDEIVRISKLFVDMGVRKIRLTGGEPLVRRDAPEIIERLSVLPVELTLTTNGLLIHKYMDVFRKAGIRSLNVSLDSLHRDKVKELTKRDCFDSVMKNIHLCVDGGLGVKINVVMLKNQNSSEIVDFIALTKDLPVHVRFIEFMPFSGNRWRSESLVTHNQILQAVDERYSYFKLKDESNATAKKYMVYGHAGTFAVITSMSEPFCSDCNRIRLTADGKLKNCLFSTGEFDILQAIRTGADASEIIQQAIRGKESERGGQFNIPLNVIQSEDIRNRCMVRIGG